MILALKPPTDPPSCECRPDGCCTTELPLDAWKAAGIHGLVVNGGRGTIAVAPGHEDGHPVVERHDGWVECREVIRR